MKKEKYIALFEENRRMLLGLDADSLKDSLTEFIFKNLTSSWPKRCCCSTVETRPQIVSLERISDNDIEMVFPEKIDLLKVFNVDNLENAYETFSNDCNCDEKRQEQKERDNEYRERRGF